jgi:hypothetical protein
MIRCPHSNTNSARRKTQLTIVLNSEPRSELVHINCRQPDKTPGVLDLGDANISDPVVTLAMSTQPDSKWNTNADARMQMDSSPVDKNVFAHRPTH